LLGDSETAWAKSFAAKHGVEALEGALSARTPIAALTGTQTGGNPPVVTKTAALSAEEAVVAEQLELTPEQFNAARPVAS
jgi:phage I-like protein